MDKNTAFLLREGYKLASLRDEQTAERREIGPDSVIVYDAENSGTEYCVTSTRITLIGREVPGGPMKDEYGIVCGEDIRGTARFLNTLAGGRVEPFNDEFRTEEDGPAEETVMSCLLRETKEELGITLNHQDVILVGLRTITEERSSALKTINGKVCVDAYFVGIIDDRLGAYCAHNGETGDRRVLPPEELLARVERGQKLPLPQTQRIALATALMTLWDLFGEGLPPAINTMIRRALPMCHSAFESSNWKNNLIKVIQKS